VVIGYFGYFATALRKLPRAGRPTWRSEFRRDVIVARGITGVGRRTWPPYKRRPPNASACSEVGGVALMIAVIGLPINHLFSIVADDCSDRARRARVTAQRGLGRLPSSSSWPALIR